MIHVHAKSTVQCAFADVTAEGRWRLEIAADDTDDKWDRVLLSGTCHICSIHAYNCAPNPSLERSSSGGFSKEPLFWTSGGERERETQEKTPQTYPMLWGVCSDNLGRHLQEVVATDRNENDDGYLLQNLLLLYVAPELLANNFRGGRERKRRYARG